MRLIRRLNPVLLSLQCTMTRECKLLYIVPEAALLFIPITTAVFLQIIEKATFMEQGGFPEQMLKTPIRLLPIPCSQADKADRLLTNHHRQFIARVTSINRNTSISARCLPPFPWDCLWTRRPPANVIWPGSRCQQ